MMLRQQLITVADAYSAAAGIGRKRVSTIVLNRGARLDEIANGGDLATGNFEKAMVWFSTNWPAGAIWPEGIERPATAQPEPAE